MKTKVLFVVAAIMSCVSVMGQWNKSAESLVSWSEDGGKVEMGLTPHGSVWFALQCVSAETATTYLTMVDSDGNRPFDQGIVVSNYPSKAWISVGKTLYVDSDGNAIVTVSDQRKGVSGSEGYTVYKISPEGEFLWGEDGISLDGENVYSLVAGMSICQLDDGSYVFAWMHTHESDDTLYTIEMQRISDDGEMLWNAMDVRLHGDNDNYTYPYVVNGGNNQVIMLYAKGTSQDLYARKIDFDGTAVWSEDTRVYNGGWGSIPIWTLMDVHPSGDGGLIVSWNDDRNSTEIESAYMAYVKSDGEIGFTSDNGQMLGYAGLRSLDVSSYYDDTSDSFYAIWRESSAGQSSNRVVAQRISKEGELLWGENGLEIEKMNNNYSYSDFSIQSTDDNEIAFFYLQSSSSTEQIPIVATVHTSDTTFRAKSCISNYISNKRNLQSTPAYNDNWLVSWIEDKQLLIQGVSCELPRLTIGDKFTVDGIHYEVLNESGQVAVTYYGEDINNIPDEYKYAGTVVIPESVTYEGVIYSVTSIGYCALSGCSGLTEITIPESVTSIGNEAFSSCSGLTEITIPESVTSIGDYAFANCSGLTEITIPNSVTSIGSNAFLHCHGLTEITIPESVTSIGDYAFYFCYGLTSIRIEAVNPPLIEQPTFEGVDKSIPVYVPSESIEAYKQAEYWSEFTNIVAYAELEAGNKFTVDGIHYEVLNESGQVAVTYYGEDKWNVPEEYKYAGEVVIPETVSYQGATYSVTSIGDYAFDNCEGLTSITIPNSVASIGYDALSTCSGLTSIVVEEDNTVYDSREDCNAIIETATNTLVAGCKNTVIPNSVTSIGNDAFNSCDGLTSITIPSSVTSIGAWAFSGCSGLTEITIPNSITSIGDYAFSYCYNLTSIRIEVVNPPVIEESTFSGIDKSISVYVPAQSGEAYRTASYWREFTNIIADNHLCAEPVQVLKLNGVLQLNELTLPVSMINDVSVLGVQCDIELPDGLTAVAKESGYDITLSERAANYSVSAKLREDGLLRVLIYPNNTTNPITGNEGELFAIKLQPNEQYDSNDKIVLRNIELTITQFNTLYARDFSVDCTIKESILGDSNRDKKVNVTDLSQMALYVNATEGVEIDTDGADADRNGVVESNDIDSVGNMVVAGSADATQNVTTSDAERPNYLQTEDMGIIILDGALLTHTAVLPIALTNTTPMMGVQCDVAIPAGLTLLEDEAGVVITPSERLGDGHVIKSAWLSTDSLRVLIYSPTATAIAGTNGTLFSLQLQVAESYEPQTTLSVTNITIASQDAQEYNAKALNVSCTITEASTGDCNQDGRVNVSDLVIVIYNILGVDTGDSNMIAADVNQDGELNVTDVVELVALILDGDNEPRKAPAQEDYETGTLALADTQIVQGTTHEVGIELSNTAPYTAFQMDVKLPECLTIEDVVVSNRTNNHSLQWREQADGSIRIVGYSLSNEAIGGEGGTLLNLVVRADNQLSEGVVEINGITFVTRDIVTHQLDKASGKVSVVTGLNDVVSTTRIYATDHKVVVDSPVAQEAAISTIDGVVQRVDLQAGRNEIPLQQGVYIVAVDAKVKKVVIR